MVNKAFLDSMKENAVLINTSRGDCVDEEALLAHLEAHKDFWCGLDVFKGEPAAKACEWKHALASHPRVYGTHHCGASTNQAESAIGQEAVRIVRAARPGAVETPGQVRFVERLARARPG